VFNGVSQDLGPIRLSRVESVSSVATEDLPDFYRNKVQATVSVDTLDDANALVETLREEAVRCVSRKAAGGTCGTTAEAPAPTPSTPAPASPTSTTPTSRTTVL
jgi:protein phosphatase